MRAGELTETIIVQKSVKTKGRNGGWSTTYEDYLKVKASVTRNNGNRAITNNEIVYQYNVNFTIRLFYKVDEDMRIVYEGKNYRICSIVPSKKAQCTTIITELINE